ncbi:MAG: MEDS domain-containing protein [bacterium]|nr:MEDS domain-containing protein [bacterium]
MENRNKNRNRKSGVEIIGDLSWGTHLCQFYRTREDLIEVLVPYFKAGLENNEFCIWIISEPLGVEEAKEALRKEIVKLDDYFRKGQIEILDVVQWYEESGRFSMDLVLKKWVEKEHQAIERGFNGVRASGDTFWLGKNNWPDFMNYEKNVNYVIDNFKLIAICTYSLDKYRNEEIIDVVANHQFAIIKEDDKWRRVEVSEFKKTEEKVQKLNKFLNNILESFSYPLYVINADDYIIQAANEVSGMANLSESQTCYAVLHKRKKPCSGELCPLEKVKKTKKNIVIEHTHYDGDGNAKFVEIHGSPIFDDKGNVKQMINYVKDITPHKIVLNSLKESKEELQNQKLALEQKDLALKEMIEHIERTKNKLKENISINMNETILPALEKFKMKGVSSDHVDLLHRYMDELTSSFGSKITQKSFKLTPREVEICNMIKNGFSNKEISDFLNISLQTVEMHRKNIRKKLNISNKDINLSSYLHEI